jgi:hypothetical protein
MRPPFAQVGAFDLETFFPAADRTQLALALLKQARAFGVGMVLATQNPVDLDYKALSNAGTWFLGRLQTERDKARVIEGLEGASAAAGASSSRSSSAAPHRPGRRGRTPAGGPEARSDTRRASGNRTCGPYRRLRFPDCGLRSRLRLRR